MVRTSLFRPLRALFARSAVACVAAPLVAAAPSHWTPSHRPWVPVEPGSAEPARESLDEGDDAYRFLAGLVEKGLFDLAIDEGRSFLERYPNHEKAPLARYRLGLAFFELERFDEARAQFEPLSQTRGFEYRAESTFRMGQCALSAEELDAAQAAFAAVLQSDQEYLHGPAVFLLGETAFRRGDIDVASQRYAELVQRFPSSEYRVGAQRGLVWCAWQSNDVSKTIERARSYLEAHPGSEGSPEVGILLGEALLEAADPGGALEAFRAVEAPGFGDASLRGQAFALAAAEDHASAAERFAELLQRFPESRFADEARLQGGIQTLRAGDPQTAARILGAQALADDSQALYWLAQAQEQTEDFEAALRSLERAAQARPDEGLAARIQVARGDVLASLGRADEALNAYESGGSEYALYAAAVTSLNGDDTQNAARLTRKLLSEHPETEYRDEARIVLSEALFTNEEYEATEEVLGQLLAQCEDPALLSQARSRLAWCRFLQDDLEGAARGFASCVQQHADEQEAEEALSMLARVALERGRAEEALDFAERYVERHPEGRYTTRVLSAAARAAGQAEGTLDRARALVEASAPEARQPEVLLALGDRLSEAGRLEAAEGFYAELIERFADSGESAQARYGLGWSRYQREAYRESFEALVAAGQDPNADPELVAAAWELATWAASQADEPNAASDAWRLFARSGADDRRRFDTARAVVAAWRRAERFPEAQEILDELLSSVQDADVALEVLVEGAYLALEAGDVDRADAQVEVARRRAADSPGVAEASFFVGEARFERGDSERARELYEAAAVAGSPVRAGALYKLGFTQMRADDLEGAQRSFETFVADHEDSELFGETLFLLGETRYRLERFEEATRAFERLAKEAPQHQVIPKALFRAGLSYGALGRWAQCESALTRLAQEQPEFPNLAEAELWRGRALAAQRKERPARAAFERVLALDRGELAARARLGLGRMAEDADRHEEALAEFLKVAVLFGHEAEVSEALYRAGVCLERLEDPDKALDQYREVVAKYPASAFAGPSQERIEALSGGSGTTGGSGSSGVTSSGD